MTPVPHRPAFGLSFDPRALSDLLQAPGKVRDLALAQLQHVVAGRLRGPELTRELAGCRKISMAGGAWRIVYAQRPAPQGSSHAAEIHVVAVRPRGGNDVYRTAAARLGINATRRPSSAFTHASRFRSPQLRAARPVGTPAPPRAAPSAPRPGEQPNQKGPR